MKEEKGRAHTEMTDQEMKLFQGSGNLVTTNITELNFPVIILREGGGSSE